MAQTPLKKPNLKRSLIFLIISAFFYQPALYLYGAFINLHAMSLGAPMAIVGYIGISAMLLPIFLRFVVGPYSDRTGRRVSLIGVGAVAAALCALGLAFASTWPELFAFRILSGIGSIFFAMLYPICFMFCLPPQKRSTAIGLFMGGSTAGTAVFTGLSGTLVNMWGFDGPYLVAAACGFLALLFLLPVRLPIFKMESKVTLSRIGQTFKFPPVLAGGLTYLLLIWTVAAFGGLYSPWSKEVLNISNTDLGLVALVSLVATTISYLVGGPIADKIGVRKLLLIAPICIAALYFLLPSFVNTVITLAIFYFVANFVSNIAMPGVMGDVAKSVSRDMQGTALGVYNSIGGIGTILGGLLGGYLAGAYGYTLSFYHIAIVGLVVIVLGLMWPKIFKARAPTPASAPAASAPAPVQAPPPDKQ